MYGLIEFYALAEWCWFLLQGADPWAVDKLGGRTALHYAARRDSVELVQLLVEAAGEGGVVKFPNRPGTK